MDAEREYSLVLLAAGMGSRFGGVKQLEPVGPCGELLVDYSIYDAVQAGFRRIVFVIRREIEPDFRERVAGRVEAWCRDRNVRVDYAYQDFRDLPAGYVCPVGRSRPWGTGHALLACRALLHGPFVVVNADDYYGKHAYRQMLAWLKELPTDSCGAYCLAGFRLANTLSDYGGVTRGICTVDGRQLMEIRETRHIVKISDKPAVQHGQEFFSLPADACVSMNMWGFTPDLLPALEREFDLFLRSRIQDERAEFVLPEVIDRLLAEKWATVTVLPTQDSWLGMTYREDVPLVRKAFGVMSQQGIYETNLYGKEYNHG